MKELVHNTIKTYREMTAAGACDTVEFFTLVGVGPAEWSELLIAYVESIK